MIQVNDPDALEDFFSADSMTRGKMEHIWSKAFPTVIPLHVSLDPSNPCSYESIKHADNQFLLKEKFDSGYVVPFRQALEQFLNIPSVLRLVVKSFKSNTLHPATEFNDVWDGEFIKSNPVLIEKKGAILAIQLYTADVEQANPLGSKKGKHKITVFYWTLLNLPPEVRSSLK